MLEQQQLRFGCCWSKFTVNLMYEFERGKTREEKIDIFLDTLGWYFHQKETPTGAYNAISKISDELEKLNQNLEKADKSSTNLTTALNKITFWGVIVATAGVTAAILNFIFEYILKK